MELTGYNLTLQLTAWNLGTASACASSVTGKGTLRAQASGRDPSSPGLGPARGGDHTRLLSFQGALLLSEALRGLLSQRATPTHPCSSTTVFLSPPNGGPGEALSCPSHQRAATLSVPPLGPRPPPAAESSRPPCSSASSCSPRPVPASPHGRCTCPPALESSPSPRPGGGEETLDSPIPVATHKLLPHHLPSHCLWPLRFISSFFRAATAIEHCFQLNVLPPKGI